MIYNFGGGETELSPHRHAIDGGFYLGLGGARKAGTVEKVWTITRIDVKPRGFAGVEVDAVAGWGNKWGRWYFGVEASYAPVTDLDFSATPGFNTHVEMENAFHAGPRLGYLIRPDTMLYAKVGYASTDMKYDRSLNVVTPEGAESRDGSSSRTQYAGKERRGETSLDGVVYALGLENQIYDKMFLRMEYNYVKYEDWNDLFRQDRAFNSNKHQRMILYLGHRF